MYKFMMVKNGQVKRSVKNNEINYFHMKRPSQNIEAAFIYNAIVP